MVNNDEYSEKKAMIIKDEIKEPNQQIKTLLNLTLFLGSISFALTGIASYLNIKNIVFINSEGIIFFPQGATMFLYGFFGLLFSINQIVITSNKVGQGYNEFDKEKGILKIFRKGFPGKNEDVNITYKISDIVSN